MDKENDTIVHTNCIDKINNINIDDNTIIIINNYKSIEEVIKHIKEIKLPKPLAVAKVKQGEFQIILSKIEDKNTYSKKLLVLSWTSQRFEYVLSSSKIMIKKELITNYLANNWEVKGILEPILLDDIFTGTYKLINSGLVNLGKVNRILPTGAIFYSSF